MVLNRNLHDDHIPTRKQHNVQLIDTLPKVYDHRVPENMRRRRGQRTLIGQPANERPLARRRMPVVFQVIPIPDQVVLVVSSYVSDDAFPHFNLGDTEVRGGLGRREDRRWDRFAKEAHYDSPVYDDGSGKK